MARVLAPTIVVMTYDRYEIKIFGNSGTVGIALNGELFSLSTVCRAIANIVKSNPKKYQLDFVDSRVHQCFFRIFGGFRTKKAPSSS